MSSNVMYGANDDPGNPISGSTSYNGLFLLQNKLFIFGTGFVPTDHIALVSNYPVKYSNKISVLAMIISFLLAISAFGASNVGEGFQAIGIIPLLIFIYGIWERNRPSRFAISITLDSGNELFFIHESYHFILKTYNQFIEALQKGQDFVANFSTTVVHGDYKNIQGENVVSVEGGSSVGNIANTNTGANGNLSNKVTFEGSSDAGHITNINKSDDNSGNKTNEVTVAGGSAAGNISNTN